MISVQNTSAPNLEEKTQNIKKPLLKLVSDLPITFFAI